MVTWTGLSVNNSDFKHQTCWFKQHTRGFKHQKGQTKTCWCRCFFSSLRQMTLLIATFWSYLICKVFATWFRVCLGLFQLTEILSFFCMLVFFACWAGVAGSVVLSEFILTSTRSWCWTLKFLKYLPHALDVTLLAFSSIFQTLLMLRSWCYARNFLHEYNNQYSGSPKQHNYWNRGFKTMKCCYLIPHMQLQGCLFSTHLIKSWPFTKPVLGSCVFTKSYSR